MKTNQRSKDNKLDIRKEKIIQVAHSFFLKYGYENTSLQMIVKETGGSLATIYELFKNKENLFKQSMQFNFRSFVEEFNAALQDNNITQGSMKDFLNTLGVRILEKITSEQSIALHRLIVIEGYKYPELLEIFKNECVEQSIKIFTQKLQDYQTSKELQIGNLKEYIIFFVNTLISPYLWDSITIPNFKPPTKEEIEKKVNQNIEIFMIYTKIKEQ
ncbi:TetR/AcrR family transcriptional regulator [Helicobacter sp. WB40]|uniref:TetR/AcrR family transcriptional regulator n=1 Tax=Helicobacter sp. WB40 TaxID=3004130 RepID=UPI0022EC0C7B|nr:TetR/AcrR family transcriptional regulator [Helicobacter sp. WB40]MDA3967347.1 TetR/AcrR family transcriptional regulator [Helicobacter sp. WB40]